MVVEGVQPRPFSDQHSEDTHSYQAAADVEMSPSFNPIPTRISSLPIEPVARRVGRYVRFWRKASDGRVT